MNCNNCKTEIKSHRWIVNGRIYCSSGCERGSKSLFEKLYKSLTK